MNLLVILNLIKDLFNEKFGPVEVIGRFSNWSWNLRRKLDITTNILLDESPYYVCNNLITININKFSGFIEWNCFTCPSILYYLQIPNWIIMTKTRWFD
jgi:hypothetical protein